ncbi:MAG TPA: response regulator transcription factor [Nocardioidaceae bacterium]|nr:response regulator transcription factor [Nocardioidaceae bacterium]
MDDNYGARASLGPGMRIVLCDDHRLLLEALATSLANQGFTIEAAVETPADAVRAVALHQPDVLIIDVNFPAGSGIDAARQVVASQPRTKVVMITGSDDPDLALEALSVGVAGYLRKDLRVNEIAAALEAAVRGDNPVDRALLREARRPRTGCKMPGERSPLDDLTNRERHILGLLVEGMSTREMVTALGVSPSTVRTHVQNIFHKLGVHSRLAAVALLTGDPAFHAPGRRDAVLI